MGKTRALRARGRVPLAALLALGGAPWLAAADCDNDVVELDPAMLVEPSSLDFGVSPIAEDTVKVVRVANPSALDLHLALELSADSDPAFRVDDPPALVLAGDTADIAVKFRPRVTGQVTATLVLTSDSERYPRAEVAMVGSGVDLGLPDIEVTPIPVDFGAVGREVVERADVRIANAGIRDLIIDEVVLSDDGGGAFRLVTTAPTGHTMRPGEEIFLKLAFSPPELGDYAGEMIVRSNDPDEAEVEVPLLGVGYDVPIAVIDTLDPVDELEPLDTVRLDGSHSYSAVPGVTIAQYEWALTVRPPGSTTVLHGDGQAGVDLVSADPRADLLLDLAGRYEVTLHVVDSRGVRSSAPDLLRVRAVPEEALHVQLVWDHPTADLDLHFVRGRDGLFDHATDCYFSNRFPDWYPETPDANPRLDIDDQSGFGPENVNVVAPAPGIKTIYVHYWNSRTTGNPEATAQVRVYVRGQIAAELTHTFSDDERMWSAAELDWPESLDDPVPLTPLGEVVEYRRPF